jgi:hypothetical protein
VARTWLLSVPWDGVITINEGLCAAKNALHKPTSDGYEPAKELWESNHASLMELDEAVQLCRRCHKLAPFCFFNGNTFAAIVRSAIGSIRELNASDSYILRNVVGHIVAGTATPEEELQFKALLQKLT